MTQTLEQQPPAGIDTHQVIVQTADVKVNAHIFRVWVHRHIENSQDVKVEKYEEGSIVATCPSVRLAVQVEMLAEKIKEKGTP
jgi:hypothetical protein